MCIHKWRLVILMYYTVNALILLWSTYSIVVPFGKQFSCLSFTPSRERRKSASNTLLTKFRLDHSNRSPIIYIIKGKKESPLKRRGGYSMLIWLTVGMLLTDINSISILLSNHSESLVFWRQAMDVAWFSIFPFANWGVLGC